jgi:hypothetical protein
MRLAGALFPLVIPVLAAGCQFAALEEIPTYTLTVSAEGVWTGADIEVRVTPDRGEPQTLRIDREGSAAFPSPLEDGTSFVVEVVRGDMYHSCTVADGEGVVSGTSSDASLRCTSTVPIELALSTSNIPVDLQRSHQAIDVSYLQQRLFVVVDGPPATLVRVDGIDVPLGSPSTLTTLADGTNDLSVAIDVAPLGLSRVFTFELRRGAAFATASAYVKATNLQAEDHFGYAVAVTNEYVAIGAPREDGGGAGSVNPPVTETATDSGAVYVFRRVGASLVPEAYLKSGAAGANAGRALAADGEFLAVGAPKAIVGSTARGSVTVFRRIGGSWWSDGHPRPSDLADGDDFGNAVAIAGDVLAAGAYVKTVGTSTFQGAVYVFRRVDGTWTEVQRLTTPHAHPSARFGRAVALAGERLAIGVGCESSAARGVLTVAPTDTGAPCSGAVYVYRNGAQGYELESVLKSSNSEVNDVFGSAVAMDENTIVAGASDEDSNATDPDDNTLVDSGAAYVFEHGATGWIETARLKSSAPLAGEWFGFSVSVLGDMIAVGALSGVGSVDLFRKTDGAWTRVDRRIQAPHPDGGDQASCGLALTTDGILVGAPLEDGTLDPSSNDARNSGAVYFLR